MNIIVQILPYVILPFILAIPLGLYMSKLVDGEKNFMTKVISPFENKVYKWLKINQKEMNWKKYLSSVLSLSVMSFIVLFLILKFQDLLPMNSNHFTGMSWTLAFNTAISFVTNTDWQSYSGETTLSNFSQIAGLTVQNFVSAAVGIAVLFALIRGLKRSSVNVIGNFWKDFIRIQLYVLIPLSLVTSVILIATGVPQTFSGSKTVDLVQPVAVNDNGVPITNAKINVKTKAVTVNGKKINNVSIITKEELPLYAQASQVAIKQLGSNGGGVLGTNSAHPYENPSPLSNFIEMTAMMLIPAALCFTFGFSIKRRREGIAIFITMTILLTFGLVVSVLMEQKGFSLAHIGNLNMEGKEIRNGVTISSIWSVFATATGTGSVNASLDSFSAFAGMIFMILIQLGEVAFGGVGSGLYGMLGFVILTVFIASLMVGRTPTYLGKKIGPKEMRMAVLACLATPLAILLGSGIAATLKSTLGSLTNSGAHGFSELLYAFSSAGGNNGSSFSGFNGNTEILNILLGLVMIIGRFLPIFAVLVIAGSMAKQKVSAETSGTLSTSNITFIVLLILVILIIGVLSFFPALSLGPIADFLTRR
ncbi:potassium-transporting ATPase subunit KdpA [Ligilactobacillus sp. WILCCON 0076]|uniref:Potassium-transporting ATPase potassium-binding subunit n=1 Tax=Ligilactobacillus ubinensis TaxID=2876789 RepID=A0A9X2FJL4_9LACO|nr:potassium-transporting ATPase subunit KdpA [Ligilactobacillus ubinensis]MCP0886625.1 potassium-transporting ATPase subunit KdpA [Ligilactobacillus ubinensis]